VVHLGERRSAPGGRQLVGQAANLTVESACMWLTCDHFVGKVSAVGQPTRLTQPSIPLGSVCE